MCSCGARAQPVGAVLAALGPGGEPGNSLWHPEVSLEVAVLLYGVLGAFSVERAIYITSITSITSINSIKNAAAVARRAPRVHAGARADDDDR